MQNELNNDILKKVEYAQCKCQAKFLMQQHNNAQQEQKQQPENAANETKKDANEVNFDNLYDMAYTREMKPKSDENLRTHVKIGNQQSELNFLGEHSNAVRFESREESAADFSKIKVNKQFKLTSYLPKMMSVPATP